jgi:hypothetical protein
MNDTKPPFSVSRTENEYKKEIGKYLVIYLKGGVTTFAGRVTEVKDNRIHLNPYEGILANRKKGWGALQMIPRDSSFLTSDIQVIEETTRKDLLNWCYIRNMENPKIKESLEKRTKTPNN